jgi:hypothetical protein
MLFAHVCICIFSAVYMYRIGEFMNFSNTETVGSYVVANLTPSAENGIFVASGYTGEIVAGRAIQLMLLEPDEGVLEGNLEALHQQIKQYIKLDPENPGRFVLSDTCRAELQVGDNAWRRLQSGFTEYSPADGTIESRSDLGASAS